MLQNHVTTLGGIIKWQWSYMF